MKLFNILKIKIKFNILKIKIKFKLFYFQNFEKRSKKMFFPQLTYEISKIFTKKV